MSSNSWIRSMSAAKRNVHPLVGVCNSPFHEEFNGQPCACVNCHPVAFCVEDPCYGCEGPTDRQCQPPDDDDDANIALSVVPNVEVRHDECGAQD